MQRPRSIVGLGWLAMDERPSGPAPSGVAALAALAAARAGHEVRIIGRIGQDRVGDELTSALRTAGVDVGALQRDPDLPTAERRVRADGTVSHRIDELEAAPDHLQWDFDLEDAARWADVVVFGLESWRSGQARSEELRMLDEADGAVRAADLTARVPSGQADGEVPRQHFDEALRHAEVALVDREALARIRIRPLDDEDATLAAAAEVSRRHEVLLLALLGDDDVRRLFVVDARTDDASPRRVRCTADASSVLVRAAATMVLDASIEAVAAALEDQSAAELANDAADAARESDRSPETPPAREHERDASASPEPDDTATR